MPDDVVLDNLLTAYGEPIARYTGQGVLTSGGGREIPCNFETGQLKRGKVLLFCHFDLPKLDFWFEWLSSGNRAETFVGTTSDGSRIAGGTEGHVYRFLIYQTSVSGTKAQIVNLDKAIAAVRQKNSQTSRSRGSIGSVTPPTSSQFQSVELLTVWTQARPQEMRYIDYPRTKGSKK